MEQIHTETWSLEPGYGSSEWCDRRTIYGSTKDLSNQGSFFLGTYNGVSKNLKKMVI